MNKETNDLFLQRNDDDVYDISIGENGDFIAYDFMDTSLLRSIYGERRALPNEMPIPETRRGWIGNQYSDHEDGSKVWLFEQAQLNRKTINGIKSSIENSLLWLFKNKAALGYTVFVSVNDEMTITASISIQRSTSMTTNRFYKLFENSGATK